MAAKIDERLSRLGSRRVGLDRIAALNEGERIQVLAKSASEQNWQKRAKDKPFTRYALGAMQAVDADYTRVSIETAERVGKQLQSSLSDTVADPVFRLQGSVPLDVHIRGISDVDLLVLRTDFLTYYVTGVLSSQGHYGAPDSGLTSVQALRQLRNSSEKILREKYPAANVDSSGSKAIKISGGSLARPVDVVPSHWNDTLEYQSSRNEAVRGVTILDAKKDSTIDNLPFLHIKLIGDRCVRLRGGLRKAIRLCKNFKADLLEEGVDINLSSYELAGLLYHADENALSSGASSELSILAEVQRFFDYIYNNADYAFALQAPDGTRKLIESTKTFEAAKRFSVELDNLSKEVAAENSITFALSSDRFLFEARKVLIQTTVPPVP